MPVASSSIIHMKVMSLCLFLGSSHRSFPHTHHDVYRSGPVFIISFIFVTVELISGLPSVMKISLLSYLQILCFHYFFSHLLLELWLNVIYLFQFIFGPIFNYNYFFSITTCFIWFSVFPPKLLNLFEVSCSHTFNFLFLLADS